MTNEKLITIQEAELTNNCPECFNQDLTLTFSQKHSYSRLFHKTTNEVSHQIRCNKCGCIIYPVKWTDDIERSFDYYRKMVRPEKASIRFTSLFFVLLLLLICLVGGAVYVYFQGLPAFN